MVHIHGVDILTFTWCCDAMVVALNLQYALTDPKTSDEDYNEAYFLAIANVEAEIARQKTIGIANGVIDEAADKPFWWNYVKAFLISNVWTSSLDSSVQNVRIFKCYVTSPVIREVVDDITWTLENIRINDPWKFDDYLKRYKEIAMISDVKNQLEYDDFIAYVMEVKDALPD